MTKRPLAVLMSALAMAATAAAGDLPSAPPGSTQPPAQAQPGPQGGDVRAACAADVKSLCTGVQPGGGRIIACLREHKDQVSDGCKQAMAGARRGPSKP